MGGPVAFRPAMDAPLTLDQLRTGHPRVPVTLREAHDTLGASRVAREAFGDQVVEHCLNAARVELDALEATVTDWELRGFERL